MNSEYFLYLGQLAYFVSLLSFLCRNMQPLRWLALVASGLAIYFSLGGPEPLWIPIFWHSLYFLVNLGHIALTRFRSRDVALNALEKFLHQTVLANFPSAEVHSFTKISTRIECEANTQLIENGTDLDSLYCILKGKAVIAVNGAQVAELGPGRFVGEMSLLTHSKTRADVFAAEPLQLLVWPHSAIESWVGSDSARLGLLQAALGTQVVEQLLREVA